MAEAEADRNFGDKSVDLQALHVAAADMVELVCVEVELNQLRNGARETAARQGRR